MTNILIVNSRDQFRNWLIKNATKEKECWVNIKRAKPDGQTFVYLDAVEEAICFGWIDSIWKNINGQLFARFSPRKKKSFWTELNKERARRLIKLGLMTEKGYAVLPSLEIKKFKIDKCIERSLKKNRCYKIFKSFPPLYQRIRSYNVSFYKNIDNKKYIKALEHLIRETKKGNMFGEWNDYGRLLNY